MKISIWFACMLVGSYIALPSLAQERPTGTWTGAIAIQGMELAMNVHFADDLSSTTIDIPPQGAFGIGLSNVRASEGSVYFELPAGPGVAVFDGKFEGPDLIKGAFSQAGQTGSFELKPKEESDTAEDETALGESVSLDLPGGSLHGSVVVPEGDTPVPIVILVAGSGPTDRDGNSSLLGGKNNSLRQLAVGLSDNGVASLRYDKRGVGQSVTAAISEADLRFDHFVNDLASWIEWARSDGRFDRIVVAGHSEGSLIGMVALQETVADGFVSIAGAGRSAPVILREQLEPKLPDALMKRSEEIMDAIIIGKTVSDVPAELATLFRPSVQPYLISWFAHDPAQVVRGLNIPVLVVQGTTDIQISVKDANALHAARPSSELLIIEGMNHVLKDVSSDGAAQLASYSDPELPINRTLVDRMARFAKSPNMK